MSQASIVQLVVHCLRHDRSHVWASPVPGHKYMEKINFAAMLATKGLAGVKLNLGECVIPDKSNIILAMLPEWSILGSIDLFFNIKFLMLSWLNMAFPQTWVLPLSKSKLCEILLIIAVDQSSHDLRHILVSRNSHSWLQIYGLRRSLVVIASKNSWE